MHWVVRNTTCKSSTIRVSRIAVTIVYAGGALSSARFEICASVLPFLLARIANAVLLIHHVDWYVVLDRRNH